MGVNTNRAYLGWYRPDYGSITWTLHDFANYGIEGYLPIIAVMPKGRGMSIYIEPTGHETSTGAETVAWWPRYFIEPTEKMKKWEIKKKAIAKKGRENELRYMKELKRWKKQLHLDSFYIWHDPDSGRTTGQGDIWILKNGKEEKEKIRSKSKKPLQEQEQEKPAESPDIAIEVFNTVWSVPYNDERYARWFLRFGTMGGLKQRPYWTFDWCNMMLDMGSIPIFAFDIPPLGDTERFRWAIVVGELGESYLNDECWFITRHGRTKFRPAGPTPAEPMVKYSLSTKDFLIWVDNYLKEDGEKEVS
jgi:hypothetical protein